MMKKLYIYVFVSVVMISVFFAQITHARDFIIRNATTTAAYFKVDGTLGYIGIATSSPAYVLDVVGTGRFTQPVIVGTPTADTHATTKSYVDSAVSSGSSTVAGSDRQIQFNDNGVFGATSTFVIDSAGNVGIGTGSPSMKLDVNGSILANGDVILGNATDGLQLRRSGTIAEIRGLDTASSDYNGISIRATAGTQLYLNTSGYVGIGTTTPAYKLDVVGTGRFTQPVIVGTPTADTHATTKSYVDSAVSSGSSTVAGSDRQIQFNNAGVFGATSTFVIDSSGRVGIGTSTPGAKLHSLSVGTTQLRLGYDASNYQDFNIQSDGSLQIAQDGGSATLALVNGSVGIATTTPQATLHVVGNVIGDTPTAPTHLTTKSYVDSAGGGNWILNGSVLYASSTSWTVGIGTTTPSGSYKLVVDGDVYFGDGSGTDMVVGGGTGKIDVGAVDPIYTIEGKQYATFMAAMVGMKEETTGMVSLESRIFGSAKRVIDFKNVEKGSDLWLFSRTTNLKNNFDNMIVILTPGFDGRVWYKKDSKNMKLTIYGSDTGEVSYRFTAPRFDSDEWTNTTDGRVEGYNLDKLIK